MMLLVFLVALLFIYLFLAMSLIHCRHTWATFTSIFVRYSLTCKTHINLTKIRIKVHVLGQQSGGHIKEN